MKNYHFDIGNSITGPIGLCAAVRAKSEAAAVAILRATLSSNDETQELYPEDERVIYLNVYFNAEEVTTKNSDSACLEEATA
jgi:hypothetical protein